MHSSRLVPQVPRAALSAMQHTSPSSQSVLSWQLSPSVRLHAHNKQAATKHNVTEVLKQSSLAARRIRVARCGAKLDALGALGGASRWL